MAKHFLLIILFVLCWCAGATANVVIERSPTLTEAVFEVLNKLPVSKYDTDEPKLIRDARLQALSEEIAKYPTEAVALITAAEAESNIAGYVGRGECDNPPPKAPNCDRNERKKVARARTYFQLHELTCKEAWAEVQGSSAELAAAVKCAARAFRGAYYGCRGKNPKGNLVGAFAGYRRRNYCEYVSDNMEARAARYRQIASKLQRAWGKPPEVYV